MRSLRYTTVPSGFNDHNGDVKPERWSELREKIEGAFTPPVRSFLRRFVRGVCVCGTGAFSAMATWSVYTYSGCVALECDERIGGAVVFGVLAVVSALPLIAWAVDARNERRERNRGPGC